MAYLPQVELAEWLELASDPNIRRYIRARILKTIFAGENDGARLKAIELYETFAVAQNEDVLEGLTTEALMEAEKRLLDWIAKNAGGAGDASA